MNEVEQSQYRVTESELRDFVERYERMNIEAAAVAEGKKEIMAEAKSRGYDTKILRKIVAQRKLDPQEVSEAEAVFEMYAEALGMLTALGQREEIHNGKCIG